MLKINRVRADIITNEKILSFDKDFTDGINIIRSRMNSSGKSSIISCIYYSLGLEEIIGGRGHKVLSSAFKTSVINEKKELNVLESKVYLEISNGSNDITIFRSAKMKNRKDSLITVFYAKLDEIKDPTIKSEDMYVHSPNSATNERGFHTFLEKFINLNLPKVPASDNDKERKLYLQLIFSAIFIEQKRGWSDIFSGMPHLGISDSKKRVIEYLLNMSTLTNEKLKLTATKNKKEIELQWELLYQQLRKSSTVLNIRINGLENKPHIIENLDDINAIFTDNRQQIELDDYITKIRYESSKLGSKSILMTSEKFHEIQVELHEIEKDISELDENYNENQLLYEKEISSIERLSNGLKLIEEDIKNNKDAQKLIKLGSEEDFSSFKNICPTCGQAISDTILISQNSNPVMTIEENINHLSSQKKLFELSIGQKSMFAEELNIKLLLLKAGRVKLQSLAFELRKDIYKVSGEISESDIEKKIEIKGKINSYVTFLEDFIEIKDTFQSLSNKWKRNLELFENLPKSKFSESDESKLSILKNYFVSNLSNFGYRSVNDLAKVEISKETYLPSINKFDLKFDSSASDHIRSIWAYTIALLQVSDTLEGNHPKILMMDEPGQHSIVLEDQGQLFSVLNGLDDNNQFIVGITMEKDVLLNLLEDNNIEQFNVIDIDDYALK